MSVADYKIILDSPATQPALGFDTTAGALRDIIEGSRPQFAIGIFGSWGSGKTTLMRAIEQKLNPGKTISVQFNAWRYEKEPHLIVPLLDTVRESLIKWSERNPSFRKEATKTAATVGKAIYSLLAGVSLKVGVPNSLELSFDANKALTQGAQFGKEEKAARVPRSFYHATFNALTDTFAEFLGPESDRRIVVFVDDLDRCLPQGALEVLEAMKLFFDLEGFVFVVGLDQAVVERSIDLKYRSDGDAEAKGAYQVRGADYIKKIFQLPYGVAPVAVTQLDEFLEAVYRESHLPPDQENELRAIVAPHLQYLVTESGVNPREIKRYINAYTLVIKIKQHLTRNVVLALQTITFRRDWEIARQAILTYRDVFTDAVTRQLGGASTAIIDLDPTLAGIPDSFLTYLTAGNPGGELLTVGTLDEYIYTGEAATSSQGTLFLDAIRNVGNVTKALRDLGAVPYEQEQTAIQPYISTVMGALSSVQSAAYNRLDRVILSWKEHLNARTSIPSTGPVGQDDFDRRKKWLEEEEQFRRRLLGQLMELYQTGGPTPRAEAASA